MVHIIRTIYNLALFMDQVTAHCFTTQKLNRRNPNFRSIFPIFSQTRRINKHY